MKKSRGAKVGIFIIIGVLLFAAGLFEIGNRNQVFQHHYTVYVDFANIDTITSGARVRVSGMNAGQVENVAIPKDPSSKFRLKLDVDDKFRNIIRENSIATIETEGMVGNKFVNIAKGTNASPDCQPGCTLQTQEPFEISDLLKQGKSLVQTVQGTINDVQHHADTAIDNFAKVGSNVDGMVTSVRGKVQTIASNGAQITGRVNAIVASVQQGKGTVGKLLSDPQMASDVQTTVAQAKQTTTNIEQASAKAKDMVDQFDKQKIPQEVHQTIANAEDTTQQIKSAVTDFLAAAPDGTNTADSLKQTIVDAHRATRNLASDTEAVKHNFFLRGFFHRRGFYNLTQLNRKEYESSEFVKHANKRIWLNAENLFTTSPSGTQELTLDGRATIDHALSEIADNLANNPIMVEGYADGGSPEQQYLASTQRAQDVKDYLESRFKLSPDLVGTIPLENKPPEATGLQVWSGVCLSLVVSKD